MKKLLDSLENYFTDAVLPGGTLEGIELVTIYADEKVETFPALLIGMPKEQYRSNHGNRRVLIAATVPVEIAVLSTNDVSLDAACESAREWMEKLTAAVALDDTLAGFALSALVLSGASGSNNIGGDHKVGACRAQMEIRYSRYPGA